MDIRHIIRDAAIEGNYTVYGHCLDEMDKDGISIEQVEQIMQTGKVAKSRRFPNRTRITMKRNDIMICVECGSDGAISVVTAGRERRN